MAQLSFLLKRALKRVLFTDSEIFGFVKERRITKKHPVPTHKLMAEINPGDFVVHVEHGIGKFTDTESSNGLSSHDEVGWLALT